MRLEERKRVTEKEGMRLTNYFMVMVPSNDDEIALLDKIAQSGSTFTGEIKYAGIPYCEIQLQGPANHSERARDAAQPVETAEESANNTMTIGGGLA
jgi:hypothetical protein